MRKVFTLSTLLVLFVSCLASAEEAKVEYLPKMTMLLRTKAEQNLNTNVMNFMVRNARFGLKGNITKELAYKVEIDWQDKEDIDMQDAKIIYTPIKDLEFTLGQFKSPFANDYHRNPADYSFINRNFITKRLSKNMRDVGAMVAYKLPIEFMPIKLEIGMFNGNSNNHYEQDKQKSGAAKIQISPFSKSNLTFSTYHGQVTLDKEKQTSMIAEMYDISYTHWIGDFFLDFEVAQKKFDDTLDTKYEGFFTTLAYDFKIENSSILKITPAIRYEMYNKLPDVSKESPRRISAGVTIHLKENNNSYFRIDYEKYDYKSGVKSAEDVISLEYVVRL